jgi:GR25 family glycosyltransferase involved in LPS biosynthesis
MSYFPFEKIYCLHLAENKDRYYVLKKQFEDLDINDKVEIWWTCKRNVSNHVGNMIPTLRDGFYDDVFRRNPHVYGNVFNCSFEHYTIIKQAYLRGFKNILILEDDVLFQQDKTKIENVFKEMPDDWDIIRFHTTIDAYGRSGDLSEFEEYKHGDKIPEFMCTNRGDILFHSTTCYALNQKGMKALIDEYDIFFGAADVVLNRLKNNPNIKFYHLTKNILCVPNNNFKSDII